MGTVGTFETFTTARLGIYAAQKGLSVTGNNISNINTIGYTRQRVDQVSLKTGGHDKYRSQFDNHVGNGALITGISQIRDPYLDIRYRTERSDVGFTDTKLYGLNNIAAILEEVAKGENDGDGLLYAQLQKMAESLRGLSASAGTQTNDTLVQGSAEALVSLFNKYASKLEGLRQNTIAEFEQNLTSVNEILTNIRNLNNAIRKSDIHGDPALEMRDERNRQIDELSQYLKIDVVYSMEDIGAGQEVEKLTIRLGNANPETQVTSDSAVLIDGIFGAQLEMPEKVPYVNPQYDPNDPNSFKYLKADGTGTNDIKDLTEGDLVPNIGFDLRVSKLLDSKGREWIDSNTTWTEVTPNPPGTTAVYKTGPITTGGWAEGDVIQVDGIGIVVRDSNGDITVADANDPEKLAAVIANRLNRYNNDYAVTSDGAALVFTARRPGAVGPTSPDNLTNNQGPDAAPTLPADVTNGGKGGNGTLTFTPATQETAGTDAKLPALPANTNDEKFTVTHSYAQGNGKWFAITTTIQHTLPVDLDDNDLHGSLQAMREMLTESGEFASSGTINGVDENAAIKRGIPYYQKALDLLANQFAARYNELNTGYLVDENGQYIRDTGKTNEKGQTIYETITGPGTEVTYYVDGKGTYMGLAGAVPPDPAWTEVKVTLTNQMNDNAKKAFTEFLKTTGANNKTYDSIEEFVTDSGGVKVGGNLFSNRGDSNSAEGITASNISVALDWSEGKTHVVTSYVKLFHGEVENTTQNENVDHMISMLDKALVYNPQDIDPNAASDYLFEGSFNDMLSKVWSTLGNDQRITGVMLDNHYAYMEEIDMSRDSVSGVDLNDEAMNMMQYQKAYSAACRLMTVIDEALDRLVNNTGIVGR